MAALDEVRKIQQRLTNKFPADAAKLDKVQTEDQAKRFLHWRDNQQKKFR